MLSPASPFQIHAPPKSPSHPRPVARPSAHAGPSPGERTPSLHTSKPVLPHRPVFPGPARRAISLSAVISVRAGLDPTAPRMTPRSSQAISGNCVRSRVRTYSITLRGIMCVPPRVDGASVFACVGGHHVS